MHVSSLECPTLHYRDVFRSSEVLYCSVILLLEELSKAMKQGQYFEDWHTNLRLTQCYLRRSMREE